ncbi:MAG: alpha/beta fold hydrolase [Myxococcota bacterium]
MNVDPGPFRLGPVGSTGPAVLCLHGLTGTPYEIRPPAEALASVGFACVGPLLPGHGEPVERLAATAPEEWVEAVLRAFDELQSTHPRVYVAGLSLGGLLALLLGARRAVAGLLVLAAPIRLRPLARFAVPLLAPILHSLPKRPGIRDPEARERHPGTPRMPLRSVRNLQRVQRLLLSELSRIRAPLHLIYSRLDPTVDPRDAEWIQRRVGSSLTSVRYLELSSHVLPVDVERDLVAGDCVSFLQKLEEAATAASRVDGAPGAS